MNPWLWNIKSGGLTFKRTFPFLFHSGVVVVVIGLLTPYVTPHRIPAAQAISAIKYHDPTLTFPSANDRSAFQRLYLKLRLKMFAIAAMTVCCRHVAVLGSLYVSM